MSAKWKARTGIFGCAAIGLLAIKIQAAPLEIVLVDPTDVTAQTVAQWKAERFKAVAVLAEDEIPAETYRKLARHATDAGLDLYWWIEVARNPKLAAAHPQWMASLGSHTDWQRNFPDVPQPKDGEVVKAFPWVPIGYRESFEAHLARIDRLLERLPPETRGLLLNGLQGGPSSCGCGNLQCRWAVDYHVHSTATKLEGDDVAARFVAEVKRRGAEKSVIPVWMTECENVDLPAAKNQGRAGTGLCGSVGCSTGACPVEFARQWAALTAAHERPVGLLALHTALQRTDRALGGGAGWVTNAINYLNHTLPANGGRAVPSERLWLVVEDGAAREIGVKAGVGAVIVARTKIDQSYAPKMLRK